MYIEEAIKNLEVGRKDCGMIPEKEYTRTIDLAIESLSYVREQREKGGIFGVPLLKGETVECPLCGKPSRTEVHKKCADYENYR